jgi:hypothetical protein
MGDFSCIRNSLMRSVRGAGQCHTLIERQSDTTKEKKCNCNLSLKCSLNKEFNSVYAPCSKCGGLKKVSMTAENMDQDLPISAKIIDI